LNRNRAVRVGPLSLESALSTTSTEEMQSLVKGALWYTFRWQWIIAAFFGVIGECSGIFSCYFISYLINYLRDETASLEQGIILVVIFCVSNVVSTFCRNFYIFYGFLVSIRMRRTLVAVMF